MPTVPSEPSSFKLKDIYSFDLVQTFARSVQADRPSFPSGHFVKLVFDDQWPDLELKERMRHISSCLQTVLPPNYPEAVNILTETTETLIAEQGEKMLFEYGFLADFVERFGLEHPDISIPALEQITRWTSAEFAVRPYLLNYPDRMYDQMLEWSAHPSFCVRRLATEGFRPRLPWGMGIPVLKKDPAPILPVLEKLKNDPAETVRRSVANNLNDISKDHPELVLKIANKWKGKHPDTDWVVRHACRGLLKKGHAQALALFGFDPGLDTVDIREFQHDPSVKIGEQLHFNVTIKNEGTASPAQIRLEYAVTYQTLSGKASRKVFKISEFSLAPGEERVFSKKQSFRNFTTRKHYPGVHRIEILVNGRELTNGTFEVSR